MSTLINDNDVALQAAPYRDKSTLVTVVATNTNFIMGKNGGPVTPLNTILTATPNIVFTNAATYSWYYALNTAPTAWRGFTGSLVQNRTTFAPTGTSVNAIGNYTGLTPLRTNGIGTGAVFNIIKSVIGTSYTAITITITNPGTGYQAGETIAISGASLGGATPLNDLTLTIGGLVSTLNGNTQTITATTIKSLVGLTNATSLQFKCQVEENALDTAYGYATVVYSLEQANSDSININLSKVTCTIALDTSGVGTYTATGTTITVTRGGATLVYDANGGSNNPTSSANSFAIEIVTDTGIDPTIPLRTVGTTSSTTTSYTLSGITALTADYATVTFNVIVYDASGNKTQSSFRQIQYSRVSSGVPGQDATVYFIDSTAPVVTKSTSSVYEAGQFSPIIISGKKTVIGVTTNYGYLTVTGDVTNSGVEASTASDVSITPYTLNIATTALDTKFTSRLYSAADISNNQTILLDTQVFPVVFIGSSALICTLSNESASIPVTSAGLAMIGSYNNTATLIRVFEGTTELDYATGTTTTVNGTWVVAATVSSGLTIGTTSSVSAAKYASQSIINGMTTDTGIITYTITGKTQGGKDFSFVRLQNFSKVYPGIDSNLYYLDISNPVITKTGASVDATGTHTNITITGKLAVGNTTPINSGFITVIPNIKIMSVLSNGNITCSGTGMLTVSTPIIFTGIIAAIGLVAGTTYYIKTIDSNNNLITISDTPTGSPKTFSATITSAANIFAYSEAILGISLQSTTIIPNNAGIYSLTAKLYSAGDRTLSTTKVLDSQEIVVLFKAANAINGVLSNDSVSIPCIQDSTGGAITPIAGAYNITGTTIRVYEGATELTYEPTSSNTLGRWTVSSATPSKTANVNDITAGAITGSGIFAVTANASNITVDTASIEYTITGKSLSAASFSITKRQTFSRAVSGRPGTPAVNYKIQVLTAFAWSNSGSAPTIPSTSTFNYNWTTGALVAQTATQTSGTSIGYPANWSASAGATPGNGYTLFSVFLTITAPSTDTITNAVNWGDPLKCKVSRIGYTERGTIGPVGDAARIVYIITSSPVPPATPNAGVGDVVPTSSAGTWSFNPTSVLNTYTFMYQSDGTYSAASNSIVWRAPYLSNLKVGSLSAIAADLGSITSGSINIGSGRFMVDSSGNTTIKGGGTGRVDINGEVIRIYDSSTGAIRIKLGNLDY